jgi:hypothetical protein
MRCVSVLAFTATLATLAAARLDCVVKALGGGQDDGPNILKAFQRCKSNGKVVLDGYYVVDTLLLTTGLSDVEVQLSGTGLSTFTSTDETLTSLQFSTLQISPSGHHRATT